MSKMDKFTFGKTKCQINLAQILKRYDNRKINTIVCRYYTNITTNFKQIKYIPGKTFRMNMLQLYYKDRVSAINKLKLPQDVIEHMLSSITVYYRYYLRNYNHE